MIAVDASVLVAFLSRENAHHQAALELLAAGASIRIHPVNLAESLVGSVRKNRGTQALARLRNVGVEEVGRLPDEAMRLAELRASSGLKLPNCCALLVAEALDHSLATFDERLARVARSRGVDVVGGTSDGGR
ncbi:MAG TPA: PIN domain-containing protein [Nocardioides sp.]|nr:PIN domain-containing protein [Nocardioides sp.]